MHVAGKALHVDPRVFNRKHGSVLDSGTTYAYLPEEAFTAFKAAVGVLLFDNPYSSCCSLFFPLEM